MKKAINIVLLIATFILTGCISLPKETVELSEVTGQQISELHKSHLRFVELYYEKLRDDINNFIDQRWAPLFLSKAVNNEEFRTDLDASYITSNIKANDISITWKGTALKEPQKSVVLEGVEKAVTDEKSKLGQILLGWSEEAQSQIIKKRKELLKPINEQEKLVVNEINSAFLDLQRSHAAIKGYLASAVDLKETNDQVLQKLGALEKVENVMNTVTDVNDKLNTILQAKDGVDKALQDFVEQLKASQDIIKKAVGNNNKSEEEK